MRGADQDYSYSARARRRGSTVFDAGQSIVLPGA